MANETKSGERQYWAFISYSHQDREWGDWVHQKLETFKVPKGMIGSDSRGDGLIPRRLFPIFRDREELPTSADLGTQINTALANSRYLVVICSPRSAKSIWVNEEILTYKRLGRSDRILAMIVDGEPNTFDVPGREEEECFPEALRFELGEEGKLTDRRTEPIAADVRPQGDGKDNGLLKLAAGLLGVGFDDLKQRDQHRRIQRLKALASFAILLVAVFAALGVALYFQRNEAQNQRNRAEEKEALVSHTLGQSDYLLALERLDNQEPTLALAHLARAVRTSNHRDAGMRAALLLLQRSWARPVSPALRLPDQGGVVQSVFSPDGRKIAIGTGDGEIEIRDAHTMELAAEPIDLGESTLTWHRYEGEEERKEVRDHGLFSFRFTPDGKYLAATYGVYAMEGDFFTDQVDFLRVWDAETGLPVSEEVTGSMYEMEMHPDGQLLATLGQEGGGLHSIPELAPIRDLEGQSYRYEFSSNGNYLVGVGGSAVDVWQLADGKLLSRIEGDQSHARFFPDGDHLAIETGGMIRVANLQTGTADYSLDTGLKAIQGMLPLQRGGVNQLLLWEGGTIYQVSPPQIQFELFTFPHKIVDARLTPDGRRLLVTTEDGSFQMIATEGFSKRPLLEPVNLSLGRLANANLAGSTFAISADLSPDGREVLAIGNDGAAQLYSLRLSRAGPFPTGLPSLPEDPDRSYEFLAILPDEKYVLSGVLQPRDDGDDQPRVFLGGQLLEIATLEPASGVLSPGLTIVGADFSRDGRIAVLADDSPGVTVWDLATETQLANFGDTSKDQSAVAMSPDGKLIAFSNFRYREGGGWDSGIEIWDVASKRRLRSIPIGEGIGQLRFTPDGRLIAVAVGNEMDGVGFVEVWSVETGERETPRLGAAGLEAYSGVSFAPDGGHLIASHYESSEIWSLSVDRQVSDSFVVPNIGTGFAFFGPGFSADATRLIRLDKAYDIAPPGNLPTWFADFLEAVGGVSLVGSGLARNLEDPYGSLFAMVEKLESMPTNNGWANLARWFTEAEATRRLSPSSRVSVSAFIEESLDEIEAFAPDQSWWSDRIRAEIYEVAPDSEEARPLQ